MAGGITSGIAYFVMSPGSSDPPAIAANARRGRTGRGRTRPVPAKTPAASSCRLVNIGRPSIRAVEDVVRRGCAGIVRARPAFTRTYDERGAYLKLSGPSRPRIRLPAVQATSQVAQAAAIEPIG